MTKNRYLRRAMRISHVFFLLLFIGIQSNDVNAQDIGEQDRMMSIYFGGGSYYIDFEQADKLEDLINSIDDFREYEIELHGHTDNIGSVQFNQYLSEMRCKAVFFELMRMEINPEIITVHEYGELRPVYSNQTFNGKLNNRRVDVIIRKILI